MLLYLVQNSILTQTEIITLLFSVQTEPRGYNCIWIEHKTKQKEKGEKEKEEQTAEINKYQTRQNLIFHTENAPKVQEGRQIGQLQI